jgi:hypothetical protein
MTPWSDVLQKIPFKMNSSCALRHLLSNISNQWCSAFSHCLLRSVGFTALHIFLLIFALAGIFIAIYIYIYICNGCISHTHNTNTATHTLLQSHYILRSRDGYWKHISLVNLFRYARPRALHLIHLCARSSALHAAAADARRVNKAANWFNLECIMPHYHFISIAWFVHNEPPWLCAARINFCAIRAEVEPPLCLRDLDPFEELRDSGGRSLLGPTVRKTAANVFAR